MQVVRGHPRVFRRVVSLPANQVLYPEVLASAYPGVKYCFDLELFLAVDVYRCWRCLHPTVNGVFLPTFELVDVEDVVDTPRPRDVEAICVTGDTLCDCMWAGVLGVELLHGSFA